MSTEVSVYKAILLPVIGLAEGLIIGAGTVAFLTVLGIIQRLAQLTRTYGHTISYQWAIIVGSFVFTVLTQWDIHLPLPALTTAVFGIFSGLFIGLLAAALTEVLNVLPVLARRTRMIEQLMWLLFAIVLGKITGSLLQWVFYKPYF